MELRIEGGAPLVGELSVPADKSITHRALMLSALAEGTSTVAARGVGEDNRSTARVLGGLGARVAQTAAGFEVQGVGPGGLRPPAAPLDCGNSGTTMRLVAGILAGAGVEAELVGDSSLARRPMGRVCEPLRQLGGAVAGRREDGRELPPIATHHGAFRGGHVELEVASAQVETAVLLAGVASGQAVSVRAPAPSRDHAQRMLRAAGAAVASRREPSGSALVELGASARLSAATWRVPGDFSSAAFLLAAATMVEGSRVAIRDCGVNGTRTGLLELLLELGARVTVREWREEGGEPVATLTAEHAVLRAEAAGGGPLVVAGATIPIVIDELVVLAAIAAQAAGVTEVRDARELRVKESDRVRETVRLLEAFGAAAEERPDGFVVRGPARLRPARIDVSSDHRLALTAAVLALAAPGESVLTGFEVAAVSYADFPVALAGLGAKVRSR